MSVRRAEGPSDVPTLRIAQDPAADELLGRDPLALVVGMMLDQHERQRSSRGLRGNCCPMLPGDLLVRRELAQGPARVDVNARMRGLPRVREQRRIVSWGSGAQDR
jgi:hypothetical protein